MDGGRREFVQVLIVGGAGLAAFGCGEEEDGGDSNPPNCNTSGGTAQSISANHGHVLAIPAADFSSGTDHTYSIMGSAGHDHTITLTAANLATILGGGSVDVTSTPADPGPHSHTIRAVCGRSGNPGGGGNPGDY